MTFQLVTTSIIGLSLLQAPTTWGSQICSQQLMTEYDLDNSGSMSRVEYANMLIELVPDASCDVQSAWRADDSNWATSFSHLSCLCSDKYGQVAGSGECCLSQFPTIETFPIPGAAYFTEDQQEYEDTVCGVLNIAIESECPRSKVRFDVDGSTTTEAKILPVQVTEVTAVEEEKPEIVEEPMTAPAKPLPVEESSENDEPTVTEVTAVDEVKPEIVEEPMPAAAEPLPVEENSENDKPTPDEPEESEDDDDDEEEEEEEEAIIIKTTASENAVQEPQGISTILILIIAIVGTVVISFVAFYACKGRGEAPRQPGEDMDVERNEKLAETRAVDRMEDSSSDYSEGSFVSRESLASEPV